MPDGSVIIGDYWNHRVLHYDVNGNPIGSGAPNCSVPGCLFNLGTGVYGTPYGLAVDPSTKAIYVGFECCAVEKFSLNSKGVYLSPKRIKTPVSAIRRGLLSAMTGPSMSPTWSPTRSSSSTARAPG